MTPVKFSEEVHCFLGALENITQENGGNMVNTCFVQTKQWFVTIDTHPTYDYTKEAYAPCSLYLSKKKNEEMMKIGFPSVYNWMSSMAIDNKEDMDVLEAAQSGMKKILSGLTE